MNFSKFHNPLSLPGIFLCFIVAVTLNARALTFGEFNYTATATDVTITGYTGESGNLTIPATINGLPVVNIGQDAFASSNYKLISVTIPEGVTSIGSDAFATCYYLTSVILPNSLTSIGPRAFYTCDSLVSIVIPTSVVSIGNDAFGECYSLASIEVNPSNSVFASMDGILFNKEKTTLILCPRGKIGNVTMPASVTRIENGAFYRCAGLASIAIPNSVTSIGEYAFHSCTGLTTVTIPNNVTVIDNHVFWGCSNLISVVIGNNVNSIRVNSFSRCESLYRVNFLGNAPPSMGPFAEDSPATVYYLPGTMGWGSFYHGRPTAVALTFIQQPSNTIVYQGRRVVFNVATSGSGVTYQWKKDGIDITNATGATLVLDNVQADDAASYAVVISNLEGSIPSNEAILTVYPDADGDGLTDAEESSIGSNPNDRDTDKDGVDDGLEVKSYQSNPLLKDSDLDGYEDGFEISTGFSPTSASSTPQAVSVIYPAVEFAFSADIGGTYHIQQSIDLENWVTIESNIVGQGRIETRFYPTKNQPKRYFRVWRN